MNPQLIQIMRAALEEVMAKIPANDSIFGIKVAMAEAAANGQTSFDGLVASALEQIQTVTSMLT